MMDRDEGETPECNESVRVCAVCGRIWLGVADVARCGKT